MSALETSTASPIAETLAAALAAAGTGRIDEAMALLDRSLACGVRHAGLLHARGRLRLERGDVPGSVEDLQAALAIAPGYLECWRDLYRVLNAHDELDAALQCATVARQLAATDPGVIVDEGAIRLAAGDLAGALACAEQALSFSAAYPGALNLRGAVAIRLGDIETAESVLTRAVAADPGLIDAWTNLGQIALDRKDLAVAAAHYARGCEANPRSAPAHWGLGRALWARGRHAAAIAAFEAARALAPQCADLLNDLGGCRLEAGDPERAVADLEAALLLDPDHGDALANHVQVLAALGRREDAERAVNAALVRAPDAAPVHAAAAVVHRDERRVADAIAAFSRALELRPGYKLAATGRGMMRLLDGDFPGGWQDYEARLQDHPAFAPIAWWQWRGEPLAGKSILLVAEQGIGDTVQFIRYASLLTARGASVQVLVQAGLVPMARRLPGICGVFVEGDALPRLDFQSPLMSAPLYCGTTLDTIPGRTPYVTADPERVGRWRDRLKPGPFRVGLAWSGNPRNTNDRARSMPLAALAPLFELPGIEFVGLQKDVPENHRGIAPAADIALGAGMDLEDVFAVVSQLDLVLTVDTSIAHIAGALGRETWVMLSYAHDWRWLRDRDDSPWYPRTRLFRQGPARNWGELIETVRCRLAERLRQGKTG